MFHSVSKRKVNSFIGKLFGKVIQNFNLVINDSAGQSLKITLVVKNLVFETFVEKKLFFLFSCFHDVGPFLYSLSVQFDLAKGPFK